MVPKKLEIANKACASMSQAKSLAWNNFCALNDNAFHRQVEVLLLGLDLDTLHDVRTILEENPEGDEEVVALLECLQETVFINITHCILCITEVAAQESETVSAEQRTIMKHLVEGGLVRAARSVRKLLSAFDIIALTESELE